MIPAVSLDLLKAHLRVSHDDEDVLIDQTLCAAQRAIEGRIGARIGQGEGEQPLEPDLASAILLWAGHLYEHREAVVTGTIATALPLTVDSLISPYRRWLPEPTV